LVSDNDEESDDDMSVEESGSDGSDDDEEEEEDFFTSKKNQREIADASEAEASEEEEPKVGLSLNKKKLRKITKDGPFQGKNKVFFDAEGRAISSLEYHLKKDQQAKSGAAAPEDEVNILKESDVDLTDKDQRKFLKRVKKSLKEHDEADTSLARQKLTEMRLKKKRKMKDRRGGGGQDDEDGGYEVTIGDPDEEDGQEEDLQD